MHHQGRAAWSAPLQCSTCQRIIQRGVFDPEGPANRRFTRAAVQGSPDRGEFFDTNSPGPSAPFPPAFGGYQLRLNAFLRKARSNCASTPKTLNRKVLWERYPSARSVSRRLLPGPGGS
jgi:hypothetical protein